MEPGGSGRRAGTLPQRRLSPRRAETGVGRSRCPPGRGRSAAAGPPLLTGFRGRAARAPPRMGRAAPFPFLRWPGGPPVWSAARGRGPPPATFRAAARGSVSLLLSVPEGLSSAVPDFSGVTAGGRPGRGRPGAGRAGGCPRGKSPGSGRHLALSPSPQAFARPRGRGAEAGWAGRDRPGGLVGGEGHARLERAPAQGLVATTLRFRESQTSRRSARPRPHPWPKQQGQSAALFSLGRLCPGWVSDCRQASEQVLRGARLGKPEAFTRFGVSAQLLVGSFLPKAWCSC